ncbi:MAG: ATP-binding protein [Pirellulales bacterium]
MTFSEGGADPPHSSVRQTATVVLDSATNRFVYADRAALELFGCQREKLLASSPLDFSPPVQPDGLATPRSCVEQLRAARTHGRHTFPWVHCDTRGQEFLCEVQLVQLPHAGGRLYEGTICPHALHRQTVPSPQPEAIDHFRELIEALPHIVWVRDSEGRLLYVNDYWYSYSGQSREEAFRPGSWVDTVHPDDRAHTIATFRDSLAKGLAFDCWHRVRNAATGEYRWYHSRAVCVRDAQGRVLRWIGNAIDVDDLKSVQTALGQAKFQVSETLSNLARELHGPLAALAASIDQWDASRQATAADETSLAAAQQNVDYLRHIVDDLLELSRLERGRERWRPAPLDLAKTVRQSLDEYRPLLAGDALELIEKIAAGPVPIVGDASRLAEIVTKLLDQARRTTPRDGRVQVTLAVDRPACEAVLSVVDSGAGLEPTQLAAVFEPFRPGEHSSVSGRAKLGLAIVHSLVEIHGGRVAVFSDGPSRGTTITVRLPLAWEPGADRS